METGDSDLNISKFNAGALKMVRLDKALSIINDINSNLSAFNIDYGVWNYELKLTQCDVIFLETESKMKPDDSEETLKMRDGIYTFIKENEIVKTTKNKEGNPKHEVNKVNFEVLRQYLFKYEMRVRKFMDKSGMDVAYRDMEDEDEY